MISSWTNEDIEAIMIQLNERELPFKKCEFSMLGEGMSLLGSGASARVYEAVSKGKKSKVFAIKVSGFGSRRIDSASFRSAVEVQQDLGQNSDNNIVKIYESIELRVWIRGEHDVEKVDKVDPWEETRPSGNYLHLQFILMEKLTPVLISDRLSHRFSPIKLQYLDEKEIVKVALEIGVAIDRAHKSGLIHRDIKLENIFFDTKRQRYKLGDFGISKTTDDGMASTVAFTKGYGAPEVVGTLDDRYDCTADIYSFGMLLYVLLNEMRFPESDNYHPTIFQYYQGYVPPEPVNGSDEFVDVVLKMLSFDPDDRYQSMEEVLNEFEKLRFGHRVKYQREHKNAALSLGVVFALMGAFAWKLTFMPGLEVVFNVWEYIFLLLCLVKTALYVAKRKNTIVSVVIFWFGLFLMIFTGFTWWKLVLFIFINLEQYLPGIIGGCSFVVNATYWIMHQNNYSVDDFYIYRWTAVLLITLSAFLLLAHSFLEERDEMVTKYVLGKKLLWVLPILFYLALITISWSFTAPQRILYEKIIGENAMQWFLSWKPLMVGMCGMAFCAGWIIRERFLAFVEKRREERELWV